MKYTIEAYYRHQHNHAPAIIASDDDVDQLVDSLLGETFAHTMAALYLRERPKTDNGLPDHNFRVGIDPERKLGGLKFAGLVDGTAGVWYAAGQSAHHDEVFYEYVGHPEDFPLDSELSIDHIRTAIKEFLRSGGDRPASVEWRTWPVWTSSEVQELPMGPTDGPLRLQTARWARNKSKRPVPEGDLPLHDLPIVELRDSNPDLFHAMGGGHIDDSHGATLIPLSPRGFPHPDCCELVPLLDRCYQWFAPKILPRR